MKNRTETINQYVKISNEILNLESTLLDKNAFESKYSTEYTSLKRELIVIHFTIK